MVEKIRFANFQKMQLKDLEMEKAGKVKLSTRFEGGELVAEYADPAEPVREIPIAPYLASRA